MVGVIGTVALILGLAGCSTSGSLPALGYADATGTVKASKTPGADAAPKDSWERTPEGSFDHRDYSKTRLEVQRARKLINAYRAENGLKPLALNSKLTLAAKTHSRDLAKWDRISHHGSDGSNPWKRVHRTGYKARLTAENVGTGQITIEEVFKGWQESPGHNKNLLLADAEEMGIALVHDPKTEFKTFWTLVLGSPIS
ncbi:MAG: CAP domain-containing protein [Pseudomonadota bacterium]